MTGERVRRYDVVVVGAGTTGLVAAIRLAQARASVCVVARGYGCTQLAPATVDEPLESDVAQWFMGLVAAGVHAGYEYVRRPRMVLPTALGLRKPVALAPSSMAGGDLRGASGPVVVVGSRGLRDFHAGLCAANLAAGGVDARALEFDWGLDRADANPLQIAGRFDDPEWRHRFCERLVRELGAGEQRVGLPAVLGARFPHAVHADLERRLERTVFEIPTLPPSVPGARLFAILQGALRAAGGRVVIGPRMSGVTRDANGSAVRIVTESAGAVTEYAAQRFVFATGAESLSEGAAITTGYRAAEVGVDG